MRLKTLLILVPLLLLLGAQQAQSSDWVFEGCFQPPNQSQCYDVYRHEGAYWICKACGTTNQPNENKCRPLTPYELAFGLWCS